MNVDDNLMIVRGYLAALESNDADRILAFFAPDAEIVSPTYGRMKAEPFYRKLCADTSAVRIKIHAVSCAERAPEIAFAHFEYLWTLADGVSKDLEILDRFELTAGKISALRIFADSRK